MDEESINYCYLWFRDYANQFFSAKQDIQIMIELKSKHTLRVCNNTSLIARSLGLCKEDLFLAKTIAIFHDIGRFESAEGL
jgi:HD-GYP domain-containing protein (c-di-GMP phosphodiesterase class II)